MARERKIHAADKGVLPTAPLRAAVPSPTLIAPVKVPAKHSEQMLALVRALARDAARSDHVNELSISRSPKKSHP